MLKTSTSASSCVARLAEPELLEHAFDPLRVVGVHLAAERGDVVAAHGRNLAAPGAGHFRPTCRSWPPLVQRRAWGQDRQAGPCVDRAVVALAPRRSAALAGRAAASNIVVRCTGPVRRAPPDDFVELCNSRRLSVTGWSVQYASATGTGTFAANPVTTLSGVLAGQYYLVRRRAARPDTASAARRERHGEHVATGGRWFSPSTGLACNGARRRVREISSRRSSISSATAPPRTSSRAAGLPPRSATRPPACARTRAARHRRQRCGLRRGGTDPANLLSASVSCAPPAPHLAISQVYGGGGNAGATLKNDFIEVFNRGTVPSASPAGRCSTPPRPARRGR